MPKKRDYRKNFLPILAVLTAVFLGEPVLSYAHQHGGILNLLLALTDERVIIRHGIINLDTIELPHSRIESVELARTIMARLLGYSTVMITGTGSRRTAVPFIADAHLFRAALDDILIQRDRQGKAT